MEQTTNNFQLPVDDTKVLDRVIDVYLWVNEDLNTAEVEQLGRHLIALAHRRASDVEMYYQMSRYPEYYPEELYPSLTDIIPEYEGS